MTAPAFFPYGAHLFELANKIVLSEEQYFVVQSIYRGWALFGKLIVAAIAANLLLASRLWRRPGRRWPSLAAAVLLAASLAMFFLWTYPADPGTDNWMAANADWQTLRKQREFSHGAILTFLTLCCAAFSAVQLLEPAPAPRAGEGCQPPDHSRAREW